jgi:hypothetical protein
VATGIFIGIGLEFEASQTKDKMKIRNIAIFGAISVAALALIGVGAAAQFSTTTTSTQTITSGYLSVAVSAPGSTCTAWDAFANCTAITLPNVGPVGSTFDTTPTVVTLTNDGTLPAYYDTVTVTQTNNNSAFESAIGMCDYSNPSGSSPYGHLVGVDNNGYLTSQLGTSSVYGGASAGPEYVIQPGQTDTYSLDFYAGAITDLCGTSTIPALSTTAQENGSVTVGISYAFLDS